MKLLNAICVIILIYETKADILPWFRLIKDIQLNVIGRTMSEPRLLNAAYRNKLIQKRMPQSFKFPCFDDGQNGSRAFTFSDARSKERPTSVHRLRPGDIDVIGAMGDSLTAGNGAGATNLLHVAVENRGVSWSIGGQGTWREFFTLPNVLKEFNPNLIGYSLGDAYPHHRNTQFNVAEIGAMSQDFPYMAKQLVKRITQDRRVNVQDDWKLITMMVGDNDFCLNLCDDKTSSQILEEHRRELYTALMTLKKNLPRTLVNLVPPPDASILQGFTEVPPRCVISHLFECPCLFGESNRPKFKKVRKLIKKWQQIDIEMVNLPEFNDKDDFTIVLQPFTVHAVFPVDSRGITDYTHLSMDCFHFSQKGYARAANGLWNNMMEPVGNKSTNWEDLFNRFLCPTLEHPYIYTRENSIDNNV